MAVQEAALVHVFEMLIERLTSLECEVRELREERRAAQRFEPGVYRLPRLAAHK